MGTPRIVAANEPAEPVVRAASLLPPGRALDIACAAGRHAIWLHEHGWRVTAVDRDVEAIARLLSEHPGIHARVVDLQEHPFRIEEGNYQLVICWLYHQRSLYPMMRDGISPGGIAALSALLQGRFGAQPGELRSYFPGWKILHEAETEHGEGKRATELVIQRPI